jgi:hypothetical protein
MQSMVAHTTSVLEADCSSSHWHIARLSADYTKRCWAMQANTRTLYNVKVGSSNHGTLAPTYKELKKDYRSTNIVEYEYLTLSPRRISHIMLQLATCRIAHALTSLKYHLSHWERKGNECIANIFIMCLDFCAK